MRAAHVLTAIALCAVPLTACGGSEEDKVREATTEFVDAWVDRDAQQICDRMTSQARRDLQDTAAILGRGGCPKVIARVYGLMDHDDMGDLRKFEIATVKITGDRAVVKAKAGSDPAQLRRVDGKWLIDVQRDEE